MNTRSDNMLAAPAELSEALEREAGQRDAIAYQLLLNEFDLLWSRPPQAGDRVRMDQLISLIAAYEARRRMASSA